MLIQSKKIIWFFLIFILTGCQSQSTMLQKQIKINNLIVKVEVAQTLKDQTQGLSGRQELGDNCGMLFEYFDYQIRSFWMKDMKFSLDIIWIKDNQIVDISENVPVFGANGQVGRAQSNEAVNRVLEVNSGWVSQNDVKVGDIVEGVD